jgi:hypothetical protein
VACNIFSTIPQGIGGDASFSLRLDVIGWKQTNPKCKQLRETLVLRQFSRANHGLLAGDDTGFNKTNTDNNSAMKSEAKQKTFD